MLGDAIFSGCRTYRYQLHRHWDGGEEGRILWIMLNPSTADETNNDPTITRCIQFSKDWGYECLAIGNAYALRSTDPKGLKLVRDPVGEENDHHLFEMATFAHKVVVAWGNHAKADRVAQIRKLLAGTPLFCLGTNKNGMPKHPLYLRGDTPLQPWS
jgi:hypothetical protein